MVHFMKSALKPRRKREKDRHRAEILEAAEPLFAEKGFDGTSMEAIARSAEFAVGTLYTLFESKSDLYARLLLRRWTEFLETVTASTRRARVPREQLKRLVRAEFEFMEAHRAFFRLYLHETRGFEVNVRAALGRRGLKLFDRLLDHIIGIVRRARLVGDPLHLALALQGMINAHLAIWVRQPDRMPPARAVEAILRTFFSGCTR